MKILKNLSAIIIFLISLCFISTNAVLAVEKDPITTTPIGNYRHLIEGEKIVLFKLAGEGDFISEDDIITAYGLQTYAETEKLGTGSLVFVNEDVHTIGLYGDANGDGIVNTGDAVIVKRVAAQLQELEPLQEIVLELTGNGSVDTGDAIRIQRVAAGDLAIENLVAAQLPKQEIPVLDSFEIRTLSMQGEQDGAIIRFLLSGPIEDAKMYLDGVEQAEENIVIEGNIYAVVYEVSGLIDGQTYVAKLTDGTGDFLVEKEFTYRKLDSGTPIIVATDNNEENVINSSNVNSVDIKVTFEKPNKVAGLLYLTMVDEEGNTMQEVMYAKKEATEIIFTGIDFSEMVDGTIMISKIFQAEDGNIELSFDLTEVTKSCN